MCKENTFKGAYGSLRQFVAACQWTGCYRDEFCRW